MGFSSDAISLLFKARGDTDDAKKAFGDLRTKITNDVDAIDGKGKSSFGSLAQSMGMSESAAMGLAGAIPIVAVAVAGLAVGIGYAVTSLYNLTKSAAEYGSEIFDAKEKTGLSAATLSTLKVAADNAGSSLETVTGSTAKFAKTLGAAKDGNEKAQKTLRDLGVTSYDLDTALSQATKTIFEAKDGTDQIVLSQKAFGKSGADLIPVIKQLGGDLEAATKEGERLGITLTEKDIVASDNFGDALGLLGAQAKAAAVAFTSDLMPVLTHYFTLASEWYARNKEEVRSWGTTIAMVVGDFARGITTSFNWIRDNAETLRVVLAGLTFGISEMVIKAMELLNAYYKARGLNSPKEAQEGSGQAAPQTFTPSSPGGGKGGGKSKAESDAEAQREKDLQDQLELQRRHLKQYEEDYKETLKRIRDEFKKTGDGGALVTAATEALTKFRVATSAAFAKIDDLTPEPKSQAEKDLAADDKMQRVRAFNAQMKKEVDETNGLITESAKKNADLRLQIEQKLVADLIAVNQEQARNFVKDNENAWDDVIANEIEGTNAQNVLRGEAYNSIAASLATLRDRQLIDIEIEETARKKQITDTVKDETEKYKLLGELDDLYKKRRELAEEEYQRRLKEIQEKYAVPVGDNSSKSGGAVGFLGGLNSGQLATLSKGVKSFADVAMTAFSAVGAVVSGLAQGVGDLVANWVLMGDAGGQTFRKLTAQILASVAQQAAVLAIMSLGYAALASTAIGAILLGGTPAQFLIAAAVFGGIAAGAALIGRAVAGDSFKKETTGAFGTADRPSQSSSGKGGSVYSSKENEVVEGGYNQPGRRQTMPKDQETEIASGRFMFPKQEIEVTFKLDKKGLLQAFTEDFKNKGQTRTVVLKYT